MTKHVDITKETDEWRVRPRNRKDTVHWCKGHIGIEHEPAIVRAVGPYRDDECGMKESYRDESKMVWHCSHLVRCSSCGKVLESLPSDDCPDRAAA